MNEKKSIILLLMVISNLVLSAQNQPILQLKYEENFTPTYDEVIEIYQKLDSTQFQMIEFKGYDAVDDQISPVTGLPRFGYDKSQSYTTQIKYLDTWVPTETVPVPDFYVLPQSYREVIERLDLLKIKYSRLQKDSVLEVTVDYIEEFTSPPQPYNGHFYHNKVATRSEVQKIKYYRGDLVIPIRQEKNKIPARNV